MHCRLPRPATFLATALLAAGLFTACTGDPDPGGGEDSGEQEQEQFTAEFAAPPKRRLASGVDLGDGTHQGLASIAGNQDVLVIAGWDNGGNTESPLFGISTDAGKTWRRGSVEGDQGLDEFPQAVATDGRRFLAVGEDSVGHPVTWRSDDGLTWDRAVLPRPAFRRSDSVSEVRFFNGHWFAVGSNDTDRGALESRPVLWRSKNGVAWKRIEPTDRGIRARGDVFGTDVAVHGREIVLAVEIHDDAQRDIRPGIWRSRDGGRRFRADNAPTLGSATGRAYPSSLVRHGKNYYVTMSGDGTDDASWDPVVGIGSGGAWRTVASSAINGPAEEHPTTLVRNGKRWVVAGFTSNMGESAWIGYGKDLGRLSWLQHHTLTGSGTQAIFDGTAVGSTTFLVGRTDESGSAEAAVWRLKGSKLKRLRLPREFRKGQADVEVVRMLDLGKRFLAVGTASSSAVAWKSKDFAAWRPVGLPGRSDGVAYAEINDAVELADGKVLAIGSAENSLGNDAVALLGTPRGWTRIQGPQFERRDSFGYGGMDLTGVARRGHRVVVVGNHRGPEGAQLAPLFLKTKNGRSWHAATGVDPRPREDWERLNHLSKWGSFRAPEDGSIGMSSVVATPRGFVAGGHRGNAGEGTRAVVWHSPEGGAWKAAQRLPHPKGTWSSKVTTMASHGKVVIAAGRITTKEGDGTSGAVLWVSRDRGHSWKVAWKARKLTDLRRVVPVPGGFLALGSNGSTTDLDAYALASHDGRTWSQVDLGVERTDGPGHQRYIDAIVDGKQLRIVGSDVPPGGGGSYAVTVPLPALD